MNSSWLIRLVMLVMLVPTLASCTTGPASAKQNEVKPADFVGEQPRVIVAAPAKGVTVPSTTSKAEPAIPTAPSASAATPATAPHAAAVDGIEAGSPSALVVDAMVGQVNGKPIYASEIFRSIGEDTLRRFGGSETRLGFKSRAQQLIQAKLGERVTNALILAEAERGFGEREQLGLLGWLKGQRERVIAERGGGVLAVAEQQLMQETGHGLDQEMENIRQRALVDKFLHDKLYPKINVDRREVERYFEDHRAEFSAGTSVTVRVIMTETSKAETVVEGLRTGMKFEDAARKFSVMSNADKGGLMGPYALKGTLDNFNELRWNELNSVVRTLREGQHSERVTIGANTGWVMLEKLEGGQNKTLQQMFLDIEGRIRTMKFSRLQRKYVSDLMNGGNFTPMDQMRQGLLEVAMARFARPQ